MDIIQTNRLVFREFAQADLEPLFLLLSDPTVMKYCSGPMDLTGATKWLNAAMACYKQYGYDYWAVYEKNTGDFIGQIGILNQQIAGKYEDCLAFMIGQKYWNKGYATEGALACIDYAFGPLKLDRLIATVEPENLPSIRVLKKIGMKFDGETTYADKKAYVYSIQKGEFRE
ncbi:GNAT family N-acetyltransferase [Paenibacillus puldeungensis]|uniref:GNAT family N-acetyltransferase n=1 Tax=Paenibacillus puldeungensis TaxID=696536 RepID=A0ABW3RS39_9BACL